MIFLSERGAWGKMAPIELAKALFSNIPNRITSIRIISLPVLWLIWALRLQHLLAVGLIICFISDLIDGLLARKLGMTTAIGAKLDSFADHVLFPSTICWLLVDKRSAFAGHELVLELALAMYVVTISLGLLKRRQFGGAHLLSSKIMGFGGYLFLIGIYLFSFNLFLFYFAVGSLAYFCVETSVFCFFPRLLDNKMKCMIIGFIGKDIAPKFMEKLI